MTSPAASSSSVVDVIAQVLGRWPARTAVLGAGTGERLTYAELAAAVSGWRSQLSALGLRPGDGVALFSDNCPQIVAAMLGIISGGLRYTAVHPLGSVEDLVFILGDAEIDTVVHRPGFRDDDVAQVRAALPGLRFVDIAETPAAEAPPAVVGEDAIGMLTYTGGTTGRPKGVVQSHRTLTQCFLLELADWPWRDGPRFLAATPLSHGARQIVLPVLWHGGTIVVTSGPHDLGTVVREHAIDSTFLVPSILYRLLDGDLGPDTDFASLRMVVYGGGPISPDRLAEAVRRHGQVFTQLYGQAEAPAAISTLRPEDHDPARPHLFASCGRPTPTTVVALLGDDGEPVPLGEIGEICVRGRLLMDGYWERPEETREAFAGGWLHTGDLAVADDEGYLYIVDRRKDMIVTGGSNVFCREVEDALMSHSGVVGASVVGVPHPLWGEAVSALVVRRRSATVTAAELKEVVRRKKGPVSSPKEIVFVDALPLTGLGKPDKQRIRTLLAGATADRASVQSLE